MRSTVLLIGYLAIFLIQIVLFILSLKRKNTGLWIGLFLSEAIPMLTALLLMRYFDTLPGYGVMPGLSYFGETLFSLGASVVYAGALLVSVCVFVLVKILEKRNTHVKGDVQ